MNQESHFFSEVVPTPPPQRAKAFRKAGRWCLLAALFLAPFFFLPVTDDPVGINKFFFVGILLFGAFICFLGCALEERQIEYPHSWLALAIVLLLAAQTISACLSIASSQSFWGGLSAPDSLAAFVIYALFFFLSFFFFRGVDVPKIGAAVGGGLLIATLVNIFHPAGADFGWGIMLAAALAALVVVRPGELRGNVKIIFFTLVTLVMVGLVILNYQFLWIALAVFIVIVAALRFEPREHFHYAFVFIVIALFFALVSPRLVSFLGAPQDLRPGVAATVTATQGTLKANNLLVGSGPSTFALDFEMFRPVSINQTSFWAQTFSEGHDFAITLLATGGLLGFLLLLAIIIIVIQSFLHIQSLSTELAMVTSAAVFLLGALFVYPASFAAFVIMFSLLGILIAEHSRRAVSFNAWSRGGSFVFSVALLALAALAVVAIFVAGEQYVGAILFEQSNMLAASGNYAEAYGKVNSAISLNSSDEYLRGASQIILFEAKALASSNDPSQTAEVPAAVANAVQTGKDAVLENSNDPTNWGNLGSIYEAAIPVASGADTFAEGCYQNAATLDPSNPQWDVDMARVLMESAALPANASNQSVVQADQSSAESILDKAIALKNDYADARVLLVQLYLQEGNVPAAIQKVQELEQQNPLDPGVAFELGYLYYSTNQTSQALQEFQVATILSPNYANARYFLGLIYDQEGMASQALSQFQDILVTNPGNAQVIAMIANIQAGKPALGNNASSSTLSGEPSEVSLPSAPSATKK